MLSRWAALGRLEFGWEPFSVVLDLGNTLRCYMGQISLEVEVATWLLNPVSGFGHEPFFENSKQVVCCFFVFIFTVVGLAKTAATYSPHRALGGIFDSFDLFAHCFAGVTHLVDCEGGHPLIRTDAHRTSVMTLNFRHDFVLAAVAAGSGWVIGIIDSSPQELAEILFVSYQ